MKGKLTLPFWFLITWLGNTPTAQTGMLVVTGPAPASFSGGTSTRIFTLTSPFEGPRLGARWADPWHPRRLLRDPFFFGTFGVSSWAKLPCSFAHRADLTEPLGCPRKTGKPTPSLTLGPAPLVPSLDSSSEVIAPPAPGAFATKKLCLQRPVTFARAGDENATFSLTTCDGGVAPFALDRLASVARALDVSSPAIPLPDEPTADAQPKGEWLPGIRMVDPTLVWLVQHLADAFPRRLLTVVSGYRTGDHSGSHGVGRALDLFFSQIPNETLYRFCRTLADTGCGYYPNNSFVHVDVRPPGSGRAFWVDIAAPGEPSEYVDGWPGVEEAKVGPAGSF